MSTGTRSRSNIWWYSALAVVPVVFFGLFFAYPVASIIGRGLRGDEQWHLDRVRTVLTDDHIQQVLWFTTWQALLSTAITLLLGMAGACVFARFEFPGKRILNALVTVPFVLPTVVVGAAFLALLGHGGLTENMFGVEYANTVTAILIAHVFFNYAVVVRIVGGLWAHLDPRQTDAARVLGATSFGAFWRVTLPALRPAIAAAALIVFLFTFSSFGVVQILGGPRYATLEVEIYRQTAQLLDLPTAAILSLLQLLAVSVMLAVHSRIAARRADTLTLVPTTAAARRPRSIGERTFIATNLALVAVLIGTPLTVLGYRSLDTTAGLGLDHYRALATNDYDSILAVPGWEAVGTSLRYAALATLVALVVGGAAALVITRATGRLASALDVSLMLPLGISAVTVGFGFLITLDKPPIDLRDSVWLIPLAQALVAIPFVIRTLAPVLRSIDNTLREAAAVLGASPWQTWRWIDLALAARAVAVAAGFAFAISLGEFGATVFIARIDQPTVPVAIYRLLGRPGADNYGQAMALSVVLLALCAATLLLLERFNPAPKDPSDA